MLEPLGTSLEFDEPQDAKAMPDDDLAHILLLKADLPDMTAGDVVFKLGNSGMKDLVSSLRLRAPEDSSVFGAIPCPAEELQDGCALFALADRHRFVQGIVFEMVREFGNFWGEDPFPYYIKDHKLCFESSEQASAYVRRAWRFVTENHIPAITPQAAAAITRAELYRKVCMQMARVVA